MRLTSIVQFFEKTRETSLDKELPCQVYQCGRQRPQQNEVIVTDLLGLSEALVSSNEAWIEESQSELPLRVSLQGYATDAVGGG